MLISDIFHICITEPFNHTTGRSFVPPTSLNKRPTEALYLSRCFKIKFSRFYTFLRYKILNNEDPYAQGVIFFFIGRRDRSR